MKTLKNIATKFAKEEDGAAMIEYTILIGLIAAAVILAIGVISTWIIGEWEGLATALGAS